MRLLNSSSIFLSTVFFLLLITGGVDGATINVPADYSTIQEAVNAAVDGDTVRVAPGTYPENIDFLGKAVTVESTNGAGSTILDGGRLGSVVSFITGEGADSILDGFTVKNGSGRWYGSWNIGGGIICDTASPTIRNNFITLNEVNNDGGGIACRHSSPVIENNTISENDCRYYGGGIWVAGNAFPQIEGNHICYNDTGYSGHGAGIYVEGPAAVAVISGNTITYNDADQYNGGYGGGIFSTESSSIITNNIIYHNAAYYGGGIYFSGSGGAVVTNNTIYRNSATYLAGGILNNDSSADCYNSIVRSNIAPVAPEFHSHMHDMMHYCNVKGGAAGPGNIDANPVFVSVPAGDFHLKAGDPGINMGQNDSAAADDMDGDPRPVMGTADIGADEYEYPLVLEADGFSLSLQAGGTIQFSLDAGGDYGGRKYFLLGSLSERTPGTTLPGGALLYLNRDVFMNYILGHYNSSMLSGFRDILSKGGTASAILDVPAGIIPPDLLGMTMYFAFTTENPYNLQSNPIPVVIDP